jgi:hypothetical protein
MSETDRPPLPPRKPSPLGVRLVYDSPLDQPGPSFAASPPRLPPRKSGQALPPILIDAADTNPTGTDTALCQPAPPTAITVTPATPSTPIQPGDIDAHETPQENYTRNVIDQGPAISTINVEHSPPGKGYQEVLSEKLDSAQPLLSEAAQMGKQYEWGIITVVLVLLAWLNVSLLWVILLGVSSVLYINARPEGRQALGEPARGVPGSRDASLREAVTWV